MRAPNIYCLSIFPVLAPVLFALVIIPIPSISRLTHPTQLQLCTLWPVSPHFPACLLLVTAILPSASVSSTYTFLLDSTQKQDHAIVVFLCLDIPLKVSNLGVICFIIQAYFLPLPLLAVPEVMVAPRFSSAVSVKVPFSVTSFMLSKD